MKALVASMVIFTASKISLCSPYVNLTSHLKEPYFCRADEVAAFTCVARGTDLVWVVGGRMLSYNAVARPGSIRSIQDSSIIAALVRIWESTDDGFAYRKSMLTITVQPTAADTIIVKCHNGTDDVAEERNFLQNYLAPNLTISKIITNYDSNLKAWNISWDTEGRDVVDYYVLEIYKHQPLLLKNTSAQIVALPDTFSTHSPSIKAVDRCGEEGPALPFTFPLVNSSLITQEHESIMSSGIQVAPSVHVTQIIAVIWSLYKVTM